MTCIATAATPRFTVQVSDRLLTSDATVFDPLANKAMLIGTERGVCTVAFSGAAFLRGKSTDERIAEIVTGLDLNRDALTLGDAPVAPSISWVIWHVADELESSADWRQFQSELIITGWQWKLRGGRITHYRPVLYTVSMPGAGSGPLEIGQWVPRHLPDRLGVASNISGIAPFSRAERRAYSSRLAHTRPNEDECEAILVEIVREAASRSPDAVGRDCLSVVLYGEDPWRARVRFHGDDEPTAVWKRSGDRVPIRFTPWIVHGGVAQGPMIVMGHRLVPTGGLTVDVDCPPVRVPGSEPNSIVPFARGALHRRRPGGYRHLDSSMPTAERLFGA